MRADPLAGARSGERGVGPEEDLSERVWQTLATVQDPELPINIVDLGLVYAVRIERGSVEVELTHTALGCPALEMMRDDVRTALEAVRGVDAVDVRTVWDPPWTKARLTPRGRAALLASGVSL